MSPERRNLPRLSPFALLILLCGFSTVSAQEGRMPRPRSRPGIDGVAPAPNPGGATSRGTLSGDMELRPSRRSHSVMSSPAAPRPVRRVGFYPGTRLIVPPASARCTVLPTLAYWQHRDLSAEIQWLSRSGFIPVTPLGDGVEALSDFAQVPAGWRAYGLSVPAGGTLQVEVKHHKLGWFRLMLVDQLGRPGPGMLQAAMAHQPVLVTYRNPGKDATAVYVIVDDPAWWSDAKDPYTLQVRRDWDPATTDLSRVKMVTGLWGASPSVSAEFRGPSLTGPAVFPH